jgi:Ribosomal protein L11 methyltransferase (PrmA)
MFSLADFGRMIEDRARLDAHVAAFRQVVTPSSIVLDLGAGTGIMSLLACKAGARRVYAVEPSGAVQILMTAARDNGFADRIVVLQQRSTELTLPERADVIVSDLRGVLPPHGTHFADIADARRRLLAPAGRLLPARDTMWLAVVSAPEAFRRRRGAWRSEPEGLDLRSALSFADNELEKCRARPDQQLCDAVPWARLEYQLLTDRAVRGSGTCAITKEGVGHGFCVWFDTELVEGIGYSNAPGGPEGIYGQIFFTWPEEVALQPGDRVSFEVRADPIGAEYVWTWTSEIQRPASSPVAPIRFKQSTFKSVPPSPESLRKREPAFAPALSAAGREALEVLEGMRAGLTVGELARRLAAAHPDRFPSLDRAQGFVAELAERFGN